MNDPSASGAPPVVAVDVGGTFLKVGSVGADGSLRDLSHTLTGRDRGPDSVIETIRSVVADRVTMHAEYYGAAPRCVGIAVPGHVDSEVGMAVFSENIGWRDVPLREMLMELVAVPVVLVHDVRAGAIAEARRGAGVGLSSLLFVAIGTGIGGAIVLDGNVVHGARNLAGEIGHMQMCGVTDRCGCGATGCLETRFCAAAVERRYEELTGTNLTSSEIARRVAEGEPEAAVIWQEGIDCLASALHAASMVIDPDVIVVGGGVAQAGETMFGPLVAEFRRLSNFGAGSSPIVSATLGANAGVIGAGLRAWDSLI